MVNDAQVREFHSFLQLHHEKAPATATPCCFLQFRKGGGVAHDAPLLRLTEVQVRRELDPERHDTVRHLLTQMRSYDCEKQAIVGLVFEDGSMMSEVMWRTR